MSPILLSGKQYLPQLGISYGEFLVGFTQAVMLLAIQSMLDYSVSLQPNLTTNSLP